MYRSPFGWSENPTVDARIDAARELARIVAIDSDTQRDAGTCGFLSSAFQIVRVRVGEFLFRDFRRSIAREIRNELRLRSPAVGFDATSRSVSAAVGEDSDFGLEVSVVLVRKGDGHFRAVEGGRSFVDGGYCIPYVDRCGFEFGTYRSFGSRLVPRDQELDSCLHFSW